jgi:hypothetical protein
MMAKKMGVSSPFKQSDGRTNTVSQNHYDELDENQPDNTQSIDDYVNNPDKVMNNAKKRRVNEKFELETLDDYQKASKHVPDHPLTSVKKQPAPKVERLTEEVERDNEALKNVKAKEELDRLGIAYEFKPGKSGATRCFITMKMKEFLPIIQKTWGDKPQKNDENTIWKWVKDDKVLGIFAQGNERPIATLEPLAVEDPASEEPVDVEPAESNESYVPKRKVVPSSITPYMK